MKKSKPFCYAPWTTLLYGSMYKAGAQPCCEWSGETYKDNIENYQDSEFLQNIKKTMLEWDMSTISKTCQECIEQEQYNGKSQRIITNKRVEEKKYKLNIINKLDYRPDNLCNLKCRMCSPYSSSLIEKEMVEMGLITPIDKKDVSDVLSLDLSNLSILKLIGGEPTINKNMFDIMDYIIEQDWAKNINLQYTTNCTSINDFWLSRTKKFKEVDVSMSVDATGQCFEYIRRGASWDKVQQNILKLVETTNKYDFSIVAQMTNFAMIEEWIEYFLEYNADRVNFNNINGVVGSLNTIPDEIKKEKIDYLKKLKHPVAKKAIKYLNLSKFNIQEFNKFWPYTEIRDKRWNTNIYDLHPIFDRMKNMSFN